jgi:hypothetical protein
MAMRTRYRVDGETVRLEAKDGSESIALELSRAGVGRSQPGDAGFVCGSFSRAVCVGRGHSSSWSKTASVADGHEAEATAGGIRHKVKLSD